MNSSWMWFVFGFCSRLVVERQECVFLCVSNFLCFGFAFVMEVWRRLDVLYLVALRMKISESGLWRSLSQMVRRNYNNGVELHLFGCFITEF